MKPEWMEGTIKTTERRNERKEERKKWKIETSVPYGYTHCNDVLIITNKK